MATKDKNISVDGVGFNATHFAEHSEADFIKENLGSIPDKFGDDAAKKAWLKEAYSKVVPQGTSDKKPAKGNGK